MKRNSCRPWGQKMEECETAQSTRHLLFMDILGIYCNYMFYKIQVALRFVAYFRLLLSPFPFLLFLIWLSPGFSYSSAKAALSAEDVLARLSKRNSREETKHLAYYYTLYCKTRCLPLLGYGSGGYERWVSWIFSCWMRIISSITISAWTGEGNWSSCKHYLSSYSSTVAFLSV